MSVCKIVLPALLSLLCVSNPVFAAKPAQAAQSTGTLEGKRLTDLANQCAEDYSDLAGEISTRLFKFRSAGAGLSENGRSAVLAIANKRNLSKEDCTDISAMLTNR